MDLLHHQQVVSNRPNYFWLSGILSLGIGLTFGKFLRWLIPLFPGIAMALCSGLLFVRCKTCLTGLSDEWLAETAVGAFGLLSAIVLTGWQIAIPIAVVVSGICALVQIFLSWTAGSGPCPICISLFALATVTVGAGFAEKGTYNFSIPLPVVRLITACCLALSVFLCAASYSETVAASKLGPATGFDLRSEKLFVGQPTSVLGIRNVRSGRQMSPDDRTIIVLGTDSCGPCRFAYLWASSQASFSSLFVQVSDQPPALTNVYTEYWAPGSQKLKRMPVILLVGPDRKILDEVGGWSTDPRFSAAVLQRFNSHIKQNGGK